MRLELARHPRRLQARRPIIIDELIALAEAGNQRGASMMIKMLKGLHEQGRNSQYLVKLRSSPIWELKPTSRGGETGGARGDRGISVGRTSLPGTRHMTRSKEEIKAALKLDTLPDDEFMAVLAKVGDADVVAGPKRGRTVRAYEPEEIEKIVVEGAVGSLLAHARGESRRSLSAVGTDAGVSRARVQQIEQSDNIEVATLVRVAAACGYQVGISLKPLHPGMRAFSTVLLSATR